MLKAVRGIAAALCPVAGWPAAVGLRAAFNPDVDHALLGMLGAERSVCSAVHTVRWLLIAVHGGARSCVHVDHALLGMIAAEDRTVPLHGIARPFAARAFLA